MSKNSYVAAEFKITWRRIDEEQEQVTFGNSAEIASLLSDWFIQVIKVERVYP